MTRTTTTPDYPVTLDPCEDLLQELEIFYMGSNVTILDLAQLTTPSGPKFATGQPEETTWRSTTPDPFAIPLPIAVATLNTMTQATARQFKVDTILVQNPRYRPRLVWSRDTIDRTFFSAIYAAPLGKLAMGQSVSTWKHLP